MSLCCEDVLKPLQVAPVMHITKKLLDHSGARSLFMNAIEKSILDPNDGVPPATFYLSVREIAPALYTHDVAGVVLVHIYCMI